MRLCGCGGGNRGASVGVWAAIFAPIWLVLFASGSGHSGEGGAMAEPVTPSAATPEQLEDPRFVLGYVMPTIEGEDKDLHDYKGRVVLMVNTASRCGYTRQYAGLQKLYETHRDEGLVVLGFPANNFGAQEPGTDQQIAEFCEARFGVSFPLFSKISVKGDDSHPLYKRLAKIQIEETDGEPGRLGGPPPWNFTKFLLDRSGRVVGRYSPKVEPDDERLAEKIRELLEAED